MATIIDIDKRRSNREIIDIEVRFEERAKGKQTEHLEKMKPKHPKKTSPGQGIRLKSNEETRTFVDNLYTVRHWTNGAWRLGDEPGDLGFPEGNEYD